LASSGSLSLEERASLLSEKYSSNYKVTRDSSVDDLLKSFNENREKRRKELDALLAKTKTDTDAGADSDSGRSTPEFLKKYSVKYHFGNKDKSDSNSTDANGTVETTTTTVTSSASVEESSHKKRLGGWNAKKDHPAPNGLDKIDPRQVTESFFRNQCIPKRLSDGSNAA